MTASLDPVVDVPVSVARSGECHSREIIRTQRPSTSAVWRYSSCRGLPSSSSSSWMSR